MKITHAKKISVVQRMSRKGYGVAITNGSASECVRSFELFFRPSEHVHRRLWLHHLDGMTASTPPRRDSSSPVSAPRGMLEDACLGSTRMLRRPGYVDHVVAARQGPARIRPK